MTGTCVYCGRHGPVENDHWTGHDEHRAHFDPDLHSPACPSCNKQRYRVWCTVGLDHVAVHPTATRCLRAAASLTKIASSGHAVLLAPTQVAALAGLLRGAGLTIVWLVGALVMLMVTRLATP